MGGGHGWWRRNALALGVTAVLLPATVLGAGWWEWKYAYPDSGQPIWAVEPGSSGTAELKGATWGPVRAKTVTDVAGMDVPPDARLILVVVPVTPTGTTAPGCWHPKLVEQRTGRVWLSARYELGVPGNPEEPESCVAAADGERAEPYSLVLPYVVPDDAEGPFWVEVEPLFSGSRYVRFPVDP